MFTITPTCCPKTDRFVPAGMFDVFGILTATVCLIHCLALPLLLSLLPSLAFIEAGHDATHYLLISWVLLFCLFSIIPGYRKHGQKTVLLLMFVGLIFVLTATFHQFFGLNAVCEIPLITMGNFLVMAAHMFNRRLHRHAEV